ncbi:hypothetical protein FA95DRAFT_1481936 [Auriscalpium vulgare]|uniref:Uncharacterized protein n=1 Tax=Auriscalpium vulgare TaxID=40419 RepID=A0ACB8SAX1_9AGAM|nr:hypothetical protein FA95DRAFT_1481936 [Auriscalpium vulgare]
MIQASNEGAGQEDRNTSRARWRRVKILTTSLQDGNNMLKEAGIEVQDATRKQMETQHWLELIDGSHRYGSNRLNYLVNVDAEGKLHWARNNQLVDTTSGQWKDAGHGQGIVPLEVSDASEPQPLDAPVSSDSISSGAMSDAAMHYVGPPKGNNKVTRAFWKHFTIHGTIDKLLRKTVQRNTWIYVSDKNFNMFIGIKGAWHYSYAVSAVRSLQTFHQYIDVLGQRGVDLSKVHISKAVSALWMYVYSIYPRASPSA